MKLKLEKKVFVASSGEGVLVDLHQILLIECQRFYGFFGMRKLKIIKRKFGSRDEPFFRIEI